ncbi:MAG: FAD-binding oxidoreductase [Rhizobiaceae bacterium]|nr:FAD-binding oxidoreductase [Rhizobiaceae bacterium]
MLVDVVRTQGGQAMPASLYALEDSQTPSYSLPGDLSVDVAIVGAGYTGLSTALDLARKGVDVVVLEARDVGWGASGRNGGQINPGLKFGPDIVARDLGPDAVAFSQDAADRVFEIVSDHAIDCDIRRGGTLRAAIDSADIASIEALAREAERHGIEMHLLCARDMASATGTDRYAAGLLDPAGGQLNPLKFVRGLAGAATELGARIFTNTPVSAASREGGSWLLRTPRGQVSAKSVLFATNGYTDGLVPGLRRSLLPVFSSIVASRPLPHHLAERILREGQSLFEIGTVTTYYRVDARRRLIFGGRGRMRDASGPGAFPSIAAYAERLWPDLRAVGWEFGWNGRVALTADQYPHLHRIEDSALACVGFNGRGVAMATAIGRELAGLLIDDPSHRPILPVTPIRPIALQPFWPLGVGPALAWARLRATFLR